MESFQFVDIFATKGIEYVLVIFFLVSFILFWKLLNKPAGTISNRIQAAVPLIISIEAFKFAENYFYHPGHSWVMPDNGNAVKVGIDDFAVKLIGKPDKIIMPEINEHLEQGKSGWAFEIDGKYIEMLSPVDGEVSELNLEAINNPEIINKSPYEEGWLMKINSSKKNSNFKNLLSGSYAKALLKETINDISSKITGNVGLVMRDGGLPINGFAKEISTENWDDIVKKFLLTD